MLKTIVVLTMIVTTYVPGAGGINGGMNGAHCHRGQCRILIEGDCACGSSFEFGTVFVVDEKPYTCHDRGGKIGNANLDIVYQDLRLAHIWGRRVLRVVAYSPRFYTRHMRELERLE